MYNAIYKVSVAVFILSVVALTFLAVLSIWDVFADDVFWKSVATVATIGGAAGLVMGAAKLIQIRSDTTNQKPENFEQR
jgi:hypothetical protein